MAKKMETAVEKDKSEVEQVELANEAALALALASERVQSAQTLVQLRQNELQATLASIGTEYAEGGKYRVTEVNVEKRKVGRVLVKAE